MKNLNAWICHSIYISAHPVFMLQKYLFNPTYFHHTTPTWLTIHFLTWLFILFQITLPFLRYPMRHLPFPEGDQFPLGHFWRMRDRQPPTQLVAASQIPNAGLVAVWNPFYLSARLLVTTPEAVMEVVNAHSYEWLKPAPARKLLSRVLGQGLVNVEGNAHKAMRKTVTPAFSGRQIRELVPLFWAKGMKLVEAVAGLLQREGEEVEMMELMSRVTLDIIGEAGVGMDFNTIDGDDNKLAKLYATITSTNRGPIIPFFLINVLLPPWLVRNLHGTVYSRVAVATLELRRSIRELLTEKKRDLKLNSAGHTDIIATIMRSGDFSDDYLCDQLLTFFAAGHDTTASALTWTTRFLAENPKIQDRLRAECQTHLSHTSNPTAETFDKMPYLNAVCNETLRLYPTVPTTARSAATETTVSDTRIPRGTTAILCPWAMNRDPRLWGPDAEVYNPDRWLDAGNSNGGATTPYAFLTFLFGPRSCIGQNFARTEMRCLLAAVALRFRLLPTESSTNVKMAGFVTIKPIGGMRLKVQDL